jgi:hypothetical protein
MTMTALILQAAHTAPLVSDSTNVARDTSATTLAGSLQDHGCSCTYWKDEDSSGKSILKIQCDKIGQGLKVAGYMIVGQYGISTAWTDNNSLGRIVSAPAISISSSLEQLNFRFVFSASGMPDMGSCNSELVEVEHTIKNGWYNSMTCTDISPYLKVRAVLDIPGAFDQYSSWIETPQQVQTLERESWFGKPSAYAEWKARDN